MGGGTSVSYMGPQLATPSAGQIKMEGLAADYAEKAMVPGNHMLGMAGARMGMGGQYRTPTTNSYLTASEGGGGVGNFTNMVAPNNSETRSNTTSGTANTGTSGANVSNNFTNLVNGTNNSTTPATNLTVAGNQSMVPGGGLVRPATSANSTNNELWSIGRTATEKRATQRLKPGTGITIGGGNEDSARYIPPEYENVEEDYQRTLSQAEIDDHNAAVRQRQTNEGVYGENVTNSNIPAANYNQIYDQMNYDNMTLRNNAIGTANQANADMARFRQANDTGQIQANAIYGTEQGNLNTARTNNNAALTANTANMGTALTDYNTGMTGVNTNNANLFTNMTGLGSTASTIGQNTAAAMTPLADKLTGSLTSNALGYQNKADNYENYALGLGSGATDAGISAKNYATGKATDMESYANLVGQNRNLATDAAKKQATLRDDLKSSSDLTDPLLTSAQSGTISALTDPKKAYIMSGAKDDFLNYLGNAANKGIINSSVTTKALQGIDKTIADSMNQSYGQDYELYNRTLRDNLAAKQNAVAQIGNADANYLDTLTKTAALSGQQAGIVGSAANLALQGYGAAQTGYGTGLQAVGAGANLIDTGLKANQTAASNIASGAGIQGQAGQALLAGNAQDLSALQAAGQVNQYNAANYGNMNNAAQGVYQGNITNSLQNATTNAGISGQILENANNQWGLNNTNNVNMLNTGLTTANNLDANRRQLMTTGLQNAGLAEQTALQTPLSLYNAATGQAQPANSMWGTYMGQQTALSTPGQYVKRDDGPGLFGTAVGLGSAWLSGGATKFWK